MEANINIEEIEQYLEGKLQGAALEAFEARLQTDKALANKVELLKNVDHSLEDEKVLDLQKTVMDLGEEFFQKESTEKPSSSIKKLPFYRRPLAIAASLLLLAAFGFTLWWQSSIEEKPFSYPELYASYYTAHQANNAQRGNTTDNDLYNQAVKQYQSRDFESAITSLEEHIDSIPMDMSALYLLAHAQLNKTPSDNQAATKSFLKIIVDGNGILLGKAQWYLSLIYIKQEKINLAKNLLNGVAISQDEKLAKKARELLQKINAR